MQHRHPTDREPLLGWLRQMDMRLTTAALGIGDNIVLLEHIAAGVKIKPEASENLPFAVDTVSLTTALKATLTTNPVTVAGQKLIHVTKLPMTENACQKASQSGPRVPA